MMNSIQYLLSGIVTFTAIGGLMVMITVVKRKLFEYLRKPNHKCH